LFYVAFTVLFRLLTYANFLAESITKNAKKLYFPGKMKNVFWSEDEILRILKSYIFEGIK